MRLFVSIDVDPLTEQIKTVQEPLTGLGGLRLTDPADAHATVKFLGEGDHDLDALEVAIRRALTRAAVEPFEITLSSVGAFPSREYIRVIWLGFGAGAERLRTLHRYVEAETTELGYDEERYDYTPHVTLARMENAVEKSAVQRFLEETDSEIGPLRIEDVRLKESVLTPEGPNYRTVARFEL